MFPEETGPCFIVSERNTFSCLVWCMEQAACVISQSCDSCILNAVFLALSLLDQWWKGLLSTL